MPEPRKDWNSAAMATAAGEGFGGREACEISPKVLSVVYILAAEANGHYKTASSAPEAGRQVILRGQAREVLETRAVAWMCRKLEVMEED